MQCGVALVWVRVHGLDVLLKLRPLWAVNSVLVGEFCALQSEERTQALS